MHSALLLLLVASHGPNPLALYESAAAYAQAGKKKEAIAILQRIADLDVAFEPEKDPRFESLKATPELEAVIEKFARNLAPTSHSRIALVLPDPYGILEGVAYDSKEKRFLFGTVTARKILSVGEDGEVQEVASEKEGVASVLGLAVDEANGLLWAANSAMADKRLSALLKLDLTSGKVIGSYPVPEEGKDHLLGNVVVSSSGDVLATDRAAAVIHRLRKGADKLELFFGPSSMQAPQGLCFSRDEKKLFVSDYSKGVFSIDVATKKAVQLKVPRSTTVAGIDGLYCHHGELIGTQNAFRPNRILRMSLDASGSAITKVTVLESNHPEFEEISLGVIVGDTLYYAAAPAKILKLAL